MLICKNYKKFFKIITLQILNIFLITSCTLKDFKSNDCDFNCSKNSLQTLIIPNGTSFPDKNKEYSIPYTKKDLKQKNYNIFPPM
ncbi:hypothetical protein [Buchnera aphidicola]|uniref:Lipoprotein n=1 Tax=Buchnera aphidicola (Artemisaphis artemisicola) TaxID=1241836 RepID=A0A4D6XK51_9GAMM|nr:hypothetical protein [Buchnera aphidicola]QCI15787.1 hypothetical protein D9V59_00455 [Buchnera aphidicola (Artemisaphis artemisicola)]